MKTHVFTSLNLYLQAKSLFAHSGALIESNDERLSITYDDERDNFYFLSPNIIAATTPRELHWETQQISFFGTYQACLLQRGDNFFFITGDSIPEKLEPESFLTYVRGKASSTRN